MSIENGKGDHKKTVGAAVSPSLYAEISRYARRRGVTISTLIRQSLEAHLEAEIEGRNKERFSQ